MVLVDLGIEVRAFRQSGVHFHSFWHIDNIYFVSSFLDCDFALVARIEYVFAKFF